MDYVNLRNRVARIDGVGDVKRADAVIKAVLGMIASNVDADAARRFVGHLPDPLDFDTLRKGTGPQRPESPDQAIGALGKQFGMDPMRAKHLFREVTRCVRSVFGDEPFNEIARDMSDDWHRVIGR